MNLTGRILLILVVLFVVAAVVSWYFLLRRTETSMETVIINDRVFKVEVAETMADRARGLSGREELKSDEGMLFVFGIAGKYSFWMKDMKIPIDMVWIREGKIVGVTAEVQPQPGVPIYKLTSYPPPESIDMVLEIAAGEAEKTNMKPGDLVVRGGEKVQ